MSSARQAAAETIYAVCEKGESLDDALTHYGAAVAAQEASLFKALSYGGVREYLAYRGQINQRLKKPFKPKDRILTAILVSALHQLDETEHPPYAIVNEAVGLSKHFRRKWAAGLVNAVLRGLIRDQDQRPDKNSPAQIRSNYPDWLVDQICSDWPQQCDALLHASQQKPPLTLRINIQKTRREAYLEQLQQNDIEADICRDSPVGLSLKQATAVTRIPGFEQAMVSVQDESAQLAAPLLDLAAGQRVLDACAAPGGKSLHILEIEPAVKLQVLDLPRRLPRLRDNFQRAGARATIVEGSLLEAENWWDRVHYDRILLDVPCTGTGVMRRHPDIKLRRQPENGLQFAAGQLELLQHAWRILKPGGKLLYTTCSVLAVENEQCIAKFIQKTPDARAESLPAHLGIATGHGRQRLTGQHPGDGFYYARLQKTSD